MVINCRRMGWAGHAVHVEVLTKVTFYLEGKKRLLRPRNRWFDNTNINFGDSGCVCVCGRVCVCVNCVELFQFWPQIVGFYKCCNEVSSRDTLSKTSSFREKSCKAFYVTLYLPTINAQYFVNCALFNYVSCAFRCLSTSS
jgi:hypothetical protein